MDGRLDGQIELNIYTNRWMVGRIKTMKTIDGWLDGQENKQKDGWMDIKKWMDGYKKIDGWLDGYKQMDGWMDG